MGRLPIIMLIGLCIIPTIPSRASDNELEAKIDKIFEKWNKSNIPGAAAAVVKDGKPLLIKGYGCADLEHGTPITPQTLFNERRCNLSWTGHEDCPACFSKRASAPGL
jgi:CubicO group peptidase (beta-lactamase class C family)